MREQNLWGETVDECAQRFLKTARTDDVEPSDQNEYCSARAFRCIMLFNGKDQQDLRDFYERVQAHFQQRITEQ